MNYAGIIKNDFAAASGTCVTFFTQGCPFKCKGCHNKETWDFEGGKPFNENVLKIIDNAITANNIKRNFCVMGGEPLCEENKELTLKVITHVKETFPLIKVYLWSGYTYEELKEKNDNIINQILNKCEQLVDGRYIEEQRDITLFMRGSKNQRIINLNN